MDWITIISTIIGSSTISAGVTAWFTRKKTDAEADSTAIDGAVKWADSMRKDIDEMREDLKELRTEYKELQKENHRLTIEVLQLRTELHLYKSGHKDIADAVSTLYT